MTCMPLQLTRYVSGEYVTRPVKQRRFHLMEPGTCQRPVVSKAGMRCISVRAVLAGRRWPRQKVCGLAALSGRLRLGLPVNRAGPGAVLPG